MHSSTMLKGTILVVFLCCHLHLSTATIDVGEKIGDKIVHTGILGGISTAATHAAATAVRPFYKFFIEGGTGLITRYFTLSDYFGIGQTIRKGLALTASTAGTAGWWVGSAVKKWGKKRLQEQAEEMNRWWIKQKLETLNSIKTGIAGGVGAVAAAAIGDKIVDKIDDKKDSSEDSSSSSSSGSDNNSGSGSDNNSGSGSDNNNGSGSDNNSGSGSDNNSGSGSAVAGGDVIGDDEEESNPFGVSISDQFYAKPWGIGGSGGAISSSSVFDIFGKPVKGSDSSVSSSQVVIGKPVGDQTGEADTSSTVTLVKDAFKWMTGASGSEDESSGSAVAGGSASGGGCNRRCRKEKANARKNKRRSRSADGVGADPLVAVFESIAQEDPQQCLPLVLCAIHADPQGLLTPQETKLVSVFRPLVIHRHVPELARTWIRGARQGASASQGKAGEGNTTCRKAFPNCPFSAHYLRSLMAETFGVNPQNDESIKDVHLELNLIES